LQRYNALNYYNARPLGNEIADRSQIVVPELRDTIEWIMPVLMDIFAATDKICEFEPETPGDEERAAMESEVVNYVFNRDNNGFMILHDLFKDALLMNNGYTSVGTQSKRSVKIEHYTGLNEMELSELMQSEGQIEVLEHTERLETIEPVPGQMQQVPVFDIKLRRISEKRRVVVECLPPEEVLVSSRARYSLDDCPFVEHKTLRARSDLIQEGYDEATVNKIPAGQVSLSMDALARDEFADQLSGDAPVDKSMQDVELRTVWVRVDYDKDGVAELRRIVLGGRTILENEEIEEMNVSYAAAIRMPHRHLGISLYDLLADIQQSKTMVMRLIFDNFYVSNNQRLAVDADNVNIEDLLTSRPGGLIRTTGSPAESIMPLSQQGIATDGMAVMEYLDHMREMRTGVGKDTVGVSANELQDVTKGAALAAFSSASKKVELIARMLAEGVKDMFRKIHGELVRNHDGALDIQLSGKWVSIDPSEWRNRSKVRVNVGLGSGNREELRQNLMLLGQLQSQLAHYGMVQAPQAYETFKHMARALGFENPGVFAIDPKSPGFKAPQPSPPPQLAAAQIKAKSDLEKAHIQAQIEQAKLHGAQHSEIVKLQQKMAEAHMRAQVEAMKDQTELSHASIQKHQDRGMEVLKLDQSMKETLVKVLGQILSSELDRDPSVEPGQALAQSYQDAEGTFE